MGLTAHSTGSNAADTGLVIQKKSDTDKIIALAGNPNVGKSTVFNELTGMNQHTGNWPGKTVTNVQGHCEHNQKGYILVDIPGTYSLLAHSAEEEVARDFICFGEPDATVVVCDATCLERNLNLVLQTIEITPNVIVCVNLMDEAKKKHIKIDFGQLSDNLGVPVIGTSARSRKGLNNLMDAVEQVSGGSLQCRPPAIRYLKPIEDAIAEISKALAGFDCKRLSKRFVSLKLLEQEESLIHTLSEYLGENPLNDPLIASTVDACREKLEQNNISLERLTDIIVSCIVLRAEEVCSDAITFEKCNYNARDRKIDKWLTGKWTGFPIMLLLLAVVFWITITGANYPSQLLSGGLFWVEDRLTDFCHYIGMPAWLHGALVLGIYRVLAWVVSVMLPPMAIFFPLLTLLEDLGYLPRIAFNLDKYFKKANACGKQALTMCMGFGCNAAGVVGCRIIDSPRERLIATITNNFVPCNGRFPTLIAIITMFFTFGGIASNHSGSLPAALQSAVSTLILTGVIVLGILMTFWISRLLSKTILKGIPSSFTLELPPYRRPQIGKVILRSVFDRTLFVLGRAVAVAAPAGLLIWLMANIHIGDASLLTHCSGFLDPFARLIGLDGVILMAFILGFPANEIVIPIMIMAYMAEGSLTDFQNLTQLKTLLVDNGWTPVTAICTMLFSLMHWPCSTTCMTIKKETQSIKWTLVSFILPTVIGVTVCFCVANICRLFGFAV